MISLLFSNPEIASLSSYWHTKPSSVSSKTTSLSYKVSLGKIKLFKAQHVRIVHSVLYIPHIKKLSFLNLPLKKPKALPISTLVELWAPYLFSRVRWSFSRKGVIKFINIRYAEALAGTRPFNAVQKRMLTITRERSLWWTHLWTIHLARRKGKPTLVRVLSKNLKLVVQNPPWPKKPPSKMLTFVEKSYHILRFASVSVAWRLGSAIDVWKNPTVEKSNKLSLMLLYTILYFVL